MLGFTTQNGITGSFNATTGVLTLTGSRDRRQLPDGAAVRHLREQQHQPVDVRAHGLGGRQRRHGELEHRDAQHHGRGGERPARGDDDGGALAFTEGNSATAIDTG